MSARTPAATAMAAMTLDHLSDGRFILGLGASGPQVVEGWYGQPYPKPLARTREYVEIVREIIRREHRSTSTASSTTCRCKAGTGLGKPLKSTIHPRRKEIPIFLGAEGPKNVALAGRDLRRLAAAVLQPEGERLLPAVPRRRLRRLGRRHQEGPLRGRQHAVS